MKPPIILLGILFLLIINASAQTGIRAWYKHGQVWIVWNETLPQPDVYEVYSSATPFTSVHQATLVGKVVQWEWAAGAIRDQTQNSSFNWKVPHPTRNQRHSLDSLQGLFVYTPHTTDSAYFAVVKRGDSLVTAAVNTTASVVHYTYDPINDPVVCHKQLGSTINGGHKASFWAVWADGRADHWNSRTDFPVMANAHKNGHPSIFIVSEAIDPDTTGGNSIPATLWLHGGSGNAVQSLPDSRAFVNIKPQAGILVAHNDDLAGYISLGGQPPQLLGQPTNSWFFGWAKNKDPYDPLLHDATMGDTIVNYTQRRIEWINEWLIEHYRVDPARIHINGHSMGSAGATALAKTYPSRYASVTIFNNGLAGHSNTSQGFSLFGDTAWDNPTNLYRRDGSNVPILQAFNLNDRNATERDLPLIRMFHGKNDDNGTMEWDAYVVSEYHRADSLGWGMQLYWSERGHGINTGANPNYPDHWTHGEADTMQTVRDDVAYEESKYRNTSFPAFYNHRLDLQAHDPGDGTIGTLTQGGTGNDWGTWGGYHEWNTSTLIDEADRWQVTAWLIDSAVYHNDNCPVDSLVASLAIRKPQQFAPASGTTVYWSATDSATQTTISAGEITVGADDLVSVDSIVLHRYPVKTQITFSLVPIVLSSPMLPGGRSFRIFPNPSQNQLHISVPSSSAGNGRVTLRSATGVPLMRFRASPTTTTIDVSSLKPGIYYLRHGAENLRFVKQP